MITKLNDINIVYEELGQGEPVVLLHGLALDGSIWNEVVRLYSDQARFIVPDLRGHGKTETGDSNESLEQIAYDLLALVNYLHLDKFTLAGHSMGGYISLVFAEKYPERLDGLIMVTSNAHADPPEKREARFSQAELAIGSGMAALAETLAQKFTSPAEIRQQVIPIIEKTDPRGFKNAQHAIGSRKNQFSVLENLTTPVLAIAGSDDQLMKPEVAIKMAQISRFGKAVVLPGVGHLPMLEAPLALGALIISML